MNDPGFTSGFFGTTTPNPMFDATATSSPFGSVSPSGSFGGAGGFESASTASPFGGAGGFGAAGSAFGAKEEETAGAAWKPRDGGIGGEKSAPKPEFGQG
jgi:hypothetical protein